MARSSKVLWAREDLVFYPESNEKSLEYFKQGRSLRFALRNKREKWGGRGSND